MKLDTPNEVWKKYAVVTVTYKVDYEYFVKIFGTSLNFKEYAEKVSKLFPIPNTEVTDATAKIIGKRHP